MIAALLAAAAVAGAWSAPATVPTSRTSFPFPVTVAAGADGTTAVAWRRGGDFPSTASVHVAVRERGGRWHTRALTGADAGTAGPRVAVDGRGRVVVVWVQQRSRADGLSQGPFLVRAAARDARGRWAATQTLGRSTNFSESFPDVAVDRAGDAIVVWRGRRAHSVQRAVVTALRTHGGRFGHAVALRDAGSGLRVGPRAALDAAGDATVVWTAQASHAQVRVARRPAGGSWTRGRDLGTAPGSTPLVAASAAGDVTVAWRRAELDSEGNGTQAGTVAVAQRPAGGAFGPQVGLGDAPTTAPLLAVSPAGQAWVAWAGFPVEPLATLESHVAQAPPGGAFREQPYPAGSEAAALAVLGDGHALIASAAGGVHVRELVPGGPPIAPQRVSTAGTEPRIAAAGRRAIVVWLSGGRLRYAVRDGG